jgi:serine/threonine protein kinase
MGVVYQARQVNLNRFVALKMILAGEHAREADLDRFRTEAEAVARLHHPHVVQIYEVGEYNGLPYLALEFCPGGNLKKKLGGKPLASRAAAAIVETLARAMHAAHGKGIIHRDLKPANVLLAEDGTAKVCDFGLAKKVGEAGRTASGAVLGTPSYMAPEQAGGKSRDVGPATDVYALGAILYECLTGQPPFEAETPLDTLMRVMADDPVPPSQLRDKVPRDLETICLKCLQKQPARRYASAQALADDLQRFQAGEPVRARPAGVGERFWRWCRRNPVVAGLTAAALLLATTLALVMWGLYAAGELPDSTGNQPQAHQSLESTAKAEITKLQGTWRVVAVEHSGKTLPARAGPVHRIIIKVTRSLS